MTNFSATAALALLLASMPAAPAENDLSIRIRDSSQSVKLGCTKGAVSIAFDWGQRVGSLGKVRRHLFYRVNPDVHVMLPIINSAGTKTGYAHDSARAKALIAEILRAAQKDSVLVGVFPAGADPVIGEWLDASFSYTEFTAAAEQVAQRCRWDLASDLTHPHALDTKPPTPPGYDGTFPDEE